MVKVPYFGNNYMQKHIFNKILYSLKMKLYNNGDEVLKLDQEIDKIIFVVSGCLEVYTEFEGNEFVLEKLKPGSILNYRNILLQDERMQVKVRSKLTGDGTYIQ